jgi:hypothetical protein
MQVERGWAPVVISGAKGPRAAIINGRFEQVEHDVYRKVGELDSSWLFVADNADDRTYDQPGPKARAGGAQPKSLGCWWVGSTAHKDARKANGWAHSVAPAGLSRDIWGEMVTVPPAAGPGRWLEWWVNGLSGPMCEWVEQEWKVSDRSCTGSLWMFEQRVLIRRGSLYPLRLA